MISVVVVVAATFGAVAAVFFAANASAAIAKLAFAATLAYSLLHYCI